MWISWRTKIRRRRFKERVKLIKMLHSGKDLLKTSEDIVPESLEILHLDGRDGGGGGVEADGSKFVHKPIRFQ